MGTIEDKLRYLMGTKEAIKMSIRRKGVVVSDEAPFRDYADKIEQIKEAPDVNFFGADGEVVYKYSVGDALALTELPPVPELEGFTSQGWNYSYEEFIKHVTDYGCCDVGAIYIPDDGKTRLYISASSPAPLTISVYFSQTMSNGVTINWDDGSSEDTVDGAGNVSITHTLSGKSEYIVSMDVAEGCVMGLGTATSSTAGEGILGAISNTSVAASDLLKKVAIGVNVPKISTYAFKHCQALTTVLIPNGVTELEIGAFYYCYGLRYMLLPNSLTSIQNSVFYYCHTLQDFITSSSEVTFGSSTLFYYCYRLKALTLKTKNIPGSFCQYAYSLRRLIIAEIDSGFTSIAANSFNYCDYIEHVHFSKTMSSITGCNSKYVLKKLVIDKPVGTVTLASSAFSGCRLLESIELPEGVTSINASAFNGCYNLKKISIPKTASFSSSANSCFSNCYVLQDFTLPETTAYLADSLFQSNLVLTAYRLPRAVATVSKYAFRYCYNLKEVVFPSTISTISSGAFNSCYAMRLYDFREAAKVPTLSATDGLTIGNGAKIVVPDALYDSWIVASNWSTYASSIIKASEYNYD